VPEEINDLLVADVSGEFVDVVASIDENSLVPHDITETGGGGNDPL
jgi:hypothetical protein